MFHPGKLSVRGHVHVEKLLTLAPDNNFYFNTAGNGSWVVINALSEGCIMKRMMFLIAALLIVSMPVFAQQAEGIAVPKVREGRFEREGAGEVQFVRRATTECTRKRSVLVS